MKAEIVEYPCSFYPGNYLALKVSGSGVPAACSYVKGAVSFCVPAIHYPHLDGDEEDHDTMCTFLEEIVTAVNGFHEAIALLEQALPIIDAHRRYALGEGDITASGIRSLLEKLK